MNNRCISNTQKSERNGTTKETQQGYCQNEKHTRTKVNGKKHKSLPSKKKRKTHGKLSNFIRKQCEIKRTSKVRNTVLFLFSVSLSPGRKVVSFLSYCA